jgi:hypothetical protein
MRAEIMHRNGGLRPHDIVVLTSDRSVNVTKSIRRKTVPRIAATAIALLLAASADAIVVRGSFDPSFGSPYPDLGFRGYGEFFVDDKCLAATGFVGWDSSCGGGLTYGQAMGLLSASVELYDARLLSSTPTPPTIGSPLVFQAPLAKPGDEGPIKGVYIAFDTATGKNAVKGVDTFEIGPRSRGSVTGADSAVLFPGGDLYLHFESGHIGDGCTASFDCGGLGGIESEFEGAESDPAYLRACVNGECFTSVGAEVTFTTVAVPEPGTLALVVGTLGGWFAARRRRLAS